MKLKIKPGCQIGQKLLLLSREQNVILLSAEKGTILEYDYDALFNRNR